MGDGLTDNGQKTSPGFDTLDPSLIDGDTLKITIGEHGFQCIRSILAPADALPDDALYTLKFKVMSPWRNLPGSSNTSPADGTGWLEMQFGPGLGVSSVQINEIDKAGSTGGKWIVFA